MNLENKGGKMKITLLAALLAIAGMTQAAKVSSVSVKMSDGTDLNTGDVIARCQVKVGDEFDPEQCARDVRALRDVGEYDNIVLKAEHGANGIDITYVVTPKLRFQGPLNVNGNDYWSRSKITSLSELKDGYPYGEADFEAAAGRIKRAYQKKFFPDVKVSYRLEPIQDSPGAVHVTMDIEEGARKKIHAFVLRHPKKTDKWLIALHALTGQPFEASLVAREFYDRGYNIITPSLRGHGPLALKVPGMPLRSPRSLAQLTARSDQFSPPA